MKLPQLAITSKQPTNPIPMQRFMRLPMLPKETMAGSYRRENIKYISIINM
jgi:hypothetical protein